MMRIAYRPAAVFWLLMTVSAGALQTGEPLAPAEGAHLERRLAAIVAAGRPGAAGGNTAVLPEREVNAYLEFRAQLPPGVVRPRVRLEGDGLIAVRARVDLQAAVDIVPGALRRMRGTLPVAINARLEAAHGTGRIMIESMTVAGLSLPPAVVGQLLGAFAPRARGVEWLEFDAPFELPHRIRHISVDVGEMVIVQ